MVSLQLLAEAELKRIHADYQFTADNKADKEILAEVEAQSRKALIGAILDGVLAGLLVLSVIINCFSLGRPLRERESHKTKKMDKKVYGRLSEENKKMFE